MYYTYNAKGQNDHENEYNDSDIEDNSDNDKKKHNLMVSDTIIYGKDFFNFVTVTLKNEFYF